MQEQAREAALGTQGEDGSSVGTVGSGAGMEAGPWREWEAKGAEQGQDSQLGWASGQRKRAKVNAAVKEPLGEEGIPRLGQQGTRRSPEPGC